MTRVETVSTVDYVAMKMEHVAEALNTMGATYSMISRVQNLIAKLDELRVDIMQCDLLNEGG